MKKILSAIGRFPLKAGLLSSIIFLSEISFSQNGDVKPCATTEAEQKFRNEHPELIPQMDAEREALEQFTKEFEKKEKLHRNAKTPGQVYVIPVVFHILHENGNENISNTQVFDAMRILNEDYRKRNADSAFTVDIFKTIASDSEIEFRLAQKDPNGNPTNGIDRIFSSETNVGDESSKLNPWTRSKYMNIWVVKTISSGAAGYTFLPGNWYSASKDGIIVLHNYVGSIGTGSSSRDATLTHEAGHWLNLSHTWGGTNTPGLSSNCNDDDEVSDTPNTIGWTNCNLSGTSCNSLDNVQNYMDYSYCNTMFTQGQSTRMRAALNSSTAQRNNLWKATTLSATGVDILYTANFSSNLTVVCVGETVNFRDESFYGQNSWTWSFGGGTPDSSNLQNPSITYNTPGLYDVNFTTTNGSVTKNKTVNSYILVASSQGNFLPFADSFESGTIPNNKWYVSNPDGDNTFARITGTGYSGNSCIKLDNAGNTAGNKDELIVGSFDFSMMTTVTVKFKAAYAQSNSASNDKLQAYVSPDCGTTWTPRFGKNSSQLATVSPQTAPFTPADTSQWTEYSFTLTSGLMKENVLVKFTFECGIGNNLFLDDINITGTYNPVPVLKSPFNNAINQDTITKLDWKSAGNVDLYEYQLSTDSSLGPVGLITGTKTFISLSSDSSDTEFTADNLTVDTKYYWRVRSKTGTNFSAWSSTWNFTVNLTVGINKSEIPKPIAIGSEFIIYPNPANENFFIEFSLNEEEKITVEIYDVVGKKINTVANKNFSAGKHQMQFGSAHFETGIYFIKINTGSNSVVKKIVLNH